ncbi:asparagine synthetase domain-containing protein CG17486 [Cylas formicarius]|uniref:asparagine synthetase domain-containing protein CG17486 n=1 Tax=Cylas formicarius TaxID=197179 RepID=UPI0029586A97|nr:asparagine synthetase domain-containing protein CG17486 [Cylas formicarius]
MCGIFCLIQENDIEQDLLKVFKKFQQNIENRGPDSSNCKVYTWGTHKICFAVSVLWLQGNNLTEQPLEDHSSAFIYNGDIFQGLENNLETGCGDSKLLFKLIKKCIPSDIKEMRKIQGPYAFVFHKRHANQIYFGRDVYGRRSLLVGKSQKNNSLILCSVARRNTEFDFIEVPAIGVFCLDLVTKSIKVFPWSYESRDVENRLKNLELFLNTKIHVEQQVEVINYPLEQENETLALLKSLQYSNSLFEMLLHDKMWLENVKHLGTLLQTAIQRRIETQPKFCKHCIVTKNYCVHATTGVLFSGGVDCAVLSLLCNELVEFRRPIDLINVSFDEANNFQSPDRLTGLETLEELKKCCPNRIWNFVEVNVDKQVLNKERNMHIADLVYPLNTVLDDSLGCALWFASRGISENYTSPCRVLLVGMGADELFGGYTKHRVAFKRNSWQGLKKCLEEDWSNLPYRNLGRDDRVVSDHGRQLRTPYLDENVVQFVRNLMCWEKTFPSEALSQGKGEKILLRTLAYYLGLKNTAFFKKRALQFGSRIANPKENAHEVSPRLIGVTPAK